MLDLLNGFVVELRNAGLPVSLTENLDAMEAVQHIPIEDREAFKYALGATLIKNHAHWPFASSFENNCCGPASSPSSAETDVAPTASAPPTSRAPASIQDLRMRRTPVNSKREGERGNTHALLASAGWNQRQSRKFRGKMTILSPLSWNSEELANKSAPSGSVLPASGGKNACCVDSSPLL
jgi:uncharacterized protein with von Willebrand factor type A (vWA) domain